MTADKYPMEENSLIEPSTDDEAILAVARAFASVTEEQIREVVRLKMTTRLGYRKISHRLNPILGKDTVMRIWKMYQAISKPLKPPKIAKEEEELERLRVQVAEKERVKRLRKEKEELLKRYVLLSLETEGDDLVLRIVETEVAKIYPETYRKFRQYCKCERLSPEEALRKMGVTASSIIDSFDDWYDVYNELDGKSGMECLTWEVWSEINAFLYEFVKQRVSEGSEGTEHGEGPTPRLSDEECEKMDRAFWALLQMKGNNHSIAPTRKSKEPSGASLKQRNSV